MVRKTTWLARREQARDPGPQPRQVDREVDEEEREREDLEEAARRAPEDLQEAPRDGGRVRRDVVGADPQIREDRVHRVVRAERRVDPRQDRLARSRQRGDELGELLGEHAAEGPEEGDEEDRRGPQGERDGGQARHVGGQPPDDRLHRQRHEERQAQHDDRRGRVREEERAEPHEQPDGDDHPGGAPRRAQVEDDASAHVRRRRSSGPWPGTRRARSP